MRRALALDLSAVGSIGPAEILVVLVVALIVLGPSRLPDAARSMGKALAELRRVSSGVQAEVRDAFAEAPSYPKPPPSPTDATTAAPGNGRAPQAQPHPPAPPGPVEATVVREPDPPASA